MRFIKRNSFKGDWDEPSLLLAYRRDGNLEALGVLYEEYMPLVYGVCLKYLKDEEESKDAVMQIFEQLVKKLRIHEVAHFKSWLFTLSRNYCLMEIRASGKHPTVSLDENVENDSFPHPTESDGQEGELQRMEKCIDKLPEEQKTAIRLFYLDQKCYKEIADLCGHDLNKVKSHIQNGKRNLKICMEKSRNGG